MIHYLDTMSMLDFSFLTLLVVLLLSVVFMHLNHRSYGFNQFGQPYTIRFPKKYKYLLIITLIAWLTAMVYYISSLENINY